jgi:hypothetical protein
MQDGTILRILSVSSAASSQKKQLLKLSKCSMSHTHCCALRLEDIKSTTTGVLKSETISFKLRLGIGST